MFIVFIVIMSASSGGWHFTFKAGTSQRCSHHDKELQSKFDHVCLSGGTESPRTSVLDKLYNNSGVYRCACCGEPLFPSSTKFDSGTGWPSFWAPVEGDKIGYTKDIPAMLGTEVHCKKCGAHLGHVFGGITGGGSGDTNYRYCINGVCLRYDPLTEVRLTTDVPWTVDTYFLLFIVVAGVISSCCLCTHIARFLRFTQKAGHGVRPAEMSEPAEVSECGH